MLRPARAFAILPGMLGAIGWRCLIIFTLALAASVLPGTVLAEPLQKFEKATLASFAYGEDGKVAYRFEDSGDGDSFGVRINKDGKKEFLVFRLYYVDAPEKSGTAPSDLRRIREQARYFGVVDDPKKIVTEFGKLAQDLVAAELEKPFTVYTAFASAPGRSKKPRLYAMIETAEGQDLAKLLVENGLARAMGVGRQLPGGTPSSDYKLFLEDLEMVAGLKRTGIWSATDPEKIAELRKLQRDEEQKLKMDLAFGAFGNLSEDEPLDLNAATAEDLQQIKGIGEKTSEKIVAGQPYETIKDVERLNGIGEATRKAIAKYFFVPAKKDPAR